MNLIRNNKGINLVALVIMIIVMIIIAAVAMTPSMESYDKSQEARLSTERTEVKKAVTARYGEFMVNGTLNPLIGVAVPEDYYGADKDKQELIDYLIQLFKSENRLLTDDEFNNHTIENEIIKFVNENFSDMEFTRILDHDQLIELGLDKMTLNAKYLVNYYTTDVIGPIL